MPPTPPSPSFIRWFAELGLGDIPLVGGKNASLGEMYRELAAQGVNVPNGFAITAEAYRYFLRDTQLDRQIRAIIERRDRMQAVIDKMVAAQGAATVFVR